MFRKKYSQSLGKVFDTSNCSVESIDLLVDTAMLS